MLEQILVKSKLLCLNEKEEAYGSSHFLIILREEREKLHQTTTVMQHKESKMDTISKKSIITNKIQNHELIKVAYSYQTRNIIQAPENNIPKTTLGKKKRPPVARWNE